MRTFYRVANDTNEGLWYNQQGEFTGLIHTKYDNLLNSKLEMPFDEEISGWLSVADSMEDLYRWFSKEDILHLQNHGYYIAEYQSEDIKFYDRFQHNVILQSTAILTNKIRL